MSEQAMTVAAEGLAMGYRMIANVMNKFLITHGIAISVESIRENDSMHTAFRALLDAKPLLPFDVPGRQDLGGIFPWSLGFINGRNNREIHVSLETDSAESAVNYLNWLARNDYWTKEDWITCIVDPVTAWNKRWNQVLKAPVWSDWYRKSESVAECGSTWETLRKPLKRGVRKYLVEQDPSNNQRFRYRLNPKWTNPEKSD